METTWNDKRKILSYLVTAIIILTIFFATILGIITIYLHSPNQLHIQKIVILPKGLSVTQIIDKLAAEELVRHPKFLWFIIQISNIKSQLKAGEYEFTSKITPMQVLDIIIKGKSVIRRLVVPEGSTVKQISTLLNEQQSLIGEIDEDIKEGSLLPNTYFFSYGDSKNTLINRMKHDMTALLEEAWPKRASNLPIHTIEEAVIVASIIERETYLFSEKKKIAAVFLNRLRKGMPLQADPTIIYAISAGTFSLSRPLTRADLRVDSPYNTYLYKGLPPTPISNPGKDAIEATLHPEGSNILYFVVNSNGGGHNFSADLNTHNNHVTNYRKKIKPKKVN